MLADIIASFFNDNHRTVIQVGNSLIMLFPVLNDLNIHFLARKHNRLDRIGKVINV